MGVNLHRMLTSSLLHDAGFQHGFFTREGGVSAGPFASLNLSATSGDDPALVAENRARAAARLGVAPAHLLVPSQVHGVEVALVDDASQADEVARREADALVALPGPVPLACGVRVADCVPVLVAERNSGAVAAVHAGWRGAVGGVVEAAVARLRELAGPDARLLAAVGPHLSVTAFEIGEEVAAQLEAAAPGQPVVVRAPGRRPHGDLRRLVAWQLARAGVEQVDHLEGCTLSEPERFFSFRRDGAQSGRHLAAIVPRRG
ncbi:MAG: peptidoglycan editing factor PgeF [Myxococcales bacterium]|nr:MAG: peptidoglycan editing factor PgeF [Myxococcales bacterium]